MFSFIPIMIGYLLFSASDKTEFLSEESK